MPPKKKTTATAVKKTIAKKATTPVKKSVTKAATKTPTPKKSALADKNQDGKTTRSEAKDAHLVRFHPGYTIQARRVIPLRDGDDESVLRTHTYMVAAMGPAYLLNTPRHVLPSRSRAIFVN